MNEPATEKIVRLLEEIRDGQKLQMERQAEAIARQAEIVALQRERFAKTDQIVGDAAELQQLAGNVQRKSAHLINRARFMMIFVVPFTLVLLVLVCWLAFGRVAP